MQKLKSTDNMIFLLADLPRRSYKALREIFASYEESGKGTKKHSTEKPDCRVSNFRELRNPVSSTIQELLIKVCEGHIALNLLNKECKQIKQMDRVKPLFAREVGADSWEHAAQTYPQHTMKAALKHCLAVPKLAGPALLAFQQHCSRAVRTVATALPPQWCHSSQTVYYL